MLFVSIHEWPLYPGTGPASYSGEGAGEGYTVNLPVPGGSGDAVVPLAGGARGGAAGPAWEPQLVLVSAGFDAHRADPLAIVHGDRGGLRGHDGVAAARRATRSARRSGLVLEGGYDLGALAGSMAALMPVLVDDVDAGSGRRSSGIRSLRQALARLGAVVAGALGRRRRASASASPSESASPWRRRPSSG